ncbi:DUF1722 domain-containing protein [Thiohalorhabdus sp. Cl-TMA]|uniref:DUF1722 domain-containing protein n=1 Tax=Thiohalorhabdus methylotrophus TaxID=3242694 RepID=A0ABV4TW46_9GAMM
MSINTVRIGIDQVQASAVEPGRRQPLWDELVGPLFPEGVELVPVKEMEAIKPYGYGRGRGSDLNGMVRPGERELYATLPQMPVTSLDELRTPSGRHGFRQRVRSFRRWKELVAEMDTTAALHTFHREHELAVMARDPREHARLSALVAEADDGAYPVEQLTRSYLERHMGALGRPACSQGIGAVLCTVWDRLSHWMTKQEQRELGHEIWAFMRGRIPLESVLYRAEALLIRYHQSDLAARLRDQLRDPDGTDLD